MQELAPVSVVCCKRPLALSSRINRVTNNMDSDQTTLIGSTLFAEGTLIKAPAGELVYDFCCAGPGMVYISPDR